MLLTTAFRKIHEISSYTEQHEKESQTFCRLHHLSVSRTFLTVTALFYSVLKALNLCVYVCTTEKGGEEEEEKFYMFIYRIRWMQKFNDYAKGFFSLPFLR